MTKMRNFCILLLITFLPYIIKAQCPVLNDTNIKPAVDQWLNQNIREGAEAAYGGHISLWNVSCCTNFKGLFKFATNFGENLAGWDTRRVRNMDQLFEVAQEFTANVSTWDVRNVVSMNRIFSRSSNFNADVTGVSQWKTERLRDLRYGFEFAAGFQGNMTGWDTSRLEDMDHMFADTFAFQGDVSDWQLPKVSSMDSVFHNSDQFQGIVSGWNLSDSLQTIRYAFSEVKEFSPHDKEGNMTILDWNTESVTDASFILQGSNDFDSDCVAAWDTPSLTTMSLAFSKSENLHGTLEANWDTSKVQSFATMFATTRNFTSPLVASFDAANVTDMNSLFKYSHDFAADVSRWNTSRVKNMEDLAFESRDFQSDLSSWDLSKVTTLVNAFSSAQNFPASSFVSWNTPQLKHIRNAFKDAEWSMEEYEGPFAMCWELDNVAHYGLETATCTTPEIGFDCECINLELAEIINAGCDEDTPPCVGEVPILDAESPDASPSETVDGALVEESYCERQSLELVVVVMSSLALLLV